MSVRSRRKELMKKADILWSQAIRMRESNMCEICGSTMCCESHHIIPRRYSTSRYWISNGMCLCPTCHRQVHSGKIDVGELAFSKQIVRLDEQMLEYTIDGLECYIEAIEKNRK